MHICGIYKNDIHDLICKTERDRQTERRKVWTPGLKGREGKNELGDWDLHIYPTDIMYKIDNKNLLGSNLFNL